jgi:RNA polymerase sigma-70 factor (ECF subfamily)
MAWTNAEFSRIFTELYPGLCAFLESLVGRTGLGQEIAQETFLRLYKNAPAAIPADEVRFWVYRVGRNLALNELKRAGRFRTLSEQISRALMGKEHEQLNRARWSEDSPLLYRLLRELPEHQRAALLLREVEEMTYKEIAEVLDISEAKVKVDIHRARTALKEKAQQEMDDSERRTASGQKKA